jgi:hypothetical protein
MHQLLFKEAVTSTNLRRIFTDFKWQIGNAEQGGITPGHNNRQLPGS